MPRRYIGFALYVLVALFLVVSGIRPVDRFTWWLEVSWVIAGLAVVAMLWWRGVRFTWSLKVAMVVHAAVLIYGGWYTYEQVPLGEWMKGAFGFTRNHYDRLGHLAQGLFPAVLARELLVRKRAVNGRPWLELFIFCACLAFAAAFELLEYGAALAFGSASDAYLGSQGDVWDAQHDMLCCAIGALATIAFWGPFHGRELAGLAPPATGTAG